jgi:GxxExxY protein
LNENELSEQIIGKAIEVHKTLGPGLLESVYEQALAYEIEQTEMTCQRQTPIPVTYKERTFQEGFRADLIVNKKVLIEIKSVEELKAVHFAQVLTYLKLTGLKLGLLINFNTKLLKNGIKRVVNNL